MAESKQRQFAAVPQALAAVLRLRVNAFPPVHLDEEDRGDHDPRQVIRWELLH